MKRVLSVEGVKKKLKDFRGNYAAVARHFGVTRGAVQQYCRSHEELLVIVDDVRESMKDDAEDVLQQAVLKGESWAVCFFLKCLAKDRGYIEKTDVDVKFASELAALMVGSLANRGQAGGHQAAEAPPAERNGAGNH